MSDEVQLNVIDQLVYDELQDMVRPHAEQDKNGMFLLPPKPKESVASALSKPEYAVGRSLTRLKRAGLYTDKREGPREFSWWVKMVEVTTPKEPAGNSDIDAWVEYHNTILAKIDTERTADKARIAELEAQVEELTQENERLQTAGNHHAEVVKAFQNLKIPKGWEEVMQS